MADPKTRPHRPSAQCDGQQPTGPATPGEQIASYYDQADQPIANYLAALGWTQWPHTPPERAAGADAGSAAEPPDGTVSS
jgi:hypothetical protein